jgi:glycogen(starch) synthase
VAPSRYEPFGLAPLEAALHGCALVLSDIGTFRELWDGCAEFFPSGDARALAQAIRRLSGDAQRRERLARAARTRALRRYTAGRMAAEYIELYHEMKRTWVPRPATAQMEAAA